jgi:hypothetical protein
MREERRGIEVGITKGAEKRGKRTKVFIQACLGSGKMPKVHEEELVVPPGIGPTSV